MINFNYVRFKNFLSTGDNFTEINLNAHKSTLIVGQNGAGKSTLLDAISFVLFGKPHRNINKPQLVNTINNKNCLVEIEFKVHGSNFFIRRGIKPAVFEIWRDGDLINQDSHNKEYQKQLELNILKLNHKTFHQVVVLGSSSFIPFMQLGANVRREVIEDLLDINVFSKMNMLLREKSAVVKDSIRHNDYQIDINDTKIESQEKYIKDMTRVSDGYRAEKEDNIKDLEKEKEILRKREIEITEILATQEPTVDVDIQDNSTKRKKLEQLKTEMKSQMKKIVTDDKFYEENLACPTCDSHISQKMKDEKLGEIRARAVKLNTGLLEIQVFINNLESEAQELHVQKEILNDYRNQSISKRNEISRIDRLIASINSELQNVSDDNLSVAKKDIERLLTDKKTLGETRLDLNEQFSYNQVLSELLKDTGIKTKIIKQYLPVINKLVNSYLQVLDFFVHFDLDESFKETIRSRHRDAFSYDSFSEGEKQRIDLALLFTWRQIAKMKNSVATNLLILDETFDSSLDQDGVENLIKIIDTLDDDTKVFIISHKGDLLEGKFEHKIEFHKEKNFSKVK